MRRQGYLTGNGLIEHQKTGAVSGVAVPDGLVEADRLPEPIFTPTTKAPLGQHDEPMTLDGVIAQEGAGTAEELRRITLEAYRRSAELALANGRPARAGTRSRPAR